MSDDLIEETVKDKSTLNDLAEFTISETIGSGGCGTVVKAYWKRKGLTVALKSLYIGNNSVREFIKELEILCTISLHYHQNINQFCGVAKDNNVGRYLLILQHADGGNLRDYLAKNFKNLEWKDKIRIAREIAQGLTFLHDLKVVHRDLHPKNILVHQGTMMIADFGISKKDDISTWSTRAAQGIPAFIEPKYLADGTYKRNEKSDIYSYGVVLWEISSGRPPFENLMPFEMIIRIHQGLRETPVEDTLKDYEDLYKYCWDQEPSERPDIMKVFDKLEEIMEKLNVETETDDVDKLHEIDPDHNNFDAEDLTDEVSSNTSSSGPSVHSCSGSGSGSGSGFGTFGITSGTGITPIPPQSGTGITSIPPQSGTGITSIPPIPSQQMIINQSSLIKAEHFSLISHWINQRHRNPFGRIFIRPNLRNILYKFKLLLRGSRDGFTPTIFHEKCDNKGPTLTVLRVKDTDEILGGYNPFSWESPPESRYYYTTKSFIFNLDYNRPDNSTLSKARLHESIKSGKYHGPYFRGDLCMEGDFKNETRCSCYKWYYEKDIRSREYIGQGYFSIEEYEVFQITSKREEKKFEF